ncbi:MAG: hypothetical protein AAB490_04450 [Patescibacteria group bacterium]
MKSFLTLLMVTTCFFGSALGVAAISSQTLFENDGGAVAKSLGTSGTEVSLIDCINGIKSSAGWTLAPGNCGVEHIMILANNLIRWMVGVSGAIALAMYVMGGMWMIFSGGSSARIERGKDILIGTSVALIFILGSWLIISFVLEAFDAQKELQLTELTCGDAKDCPQFMGCDGVAHRCVSLCEIKYKNAIPKRDCVRFDGCQPPLATYDVCSGPACEKLLCPGSDTVCCVLPSL